MTFKIDANGNVLDGWNSLPPSAAPTESSPKIVLSGTNTAETGGANTAALTGTVKSGATATLTVSGFTAAGTGGALSYEWYKGATKLTDAGVFSGATTAALTITGYTNTNAGAYTCKVFNTETGKDATIATTAPSATLSTVKNSQATLNPPTKATNTDTQVVLSAATGGSGGGAVTYAKNTADSAPSDGWQSGLTFNGLSANTTYYFFARKAADDDYDVATSASLSVTTAKTAIAGSIAITGTPKVGQELTLTKNGVNDSSATIKWYTDTDADASGGSAINGQTTAAYTPAVGDIGKYIYADLTAGANYSGGPLVTAAVGPVTAKPTLTAADISAKYGTAGTITITMGNNDLADAFNTAGGTFAITKTDAKGLIGTLGTTTWVEASHHWTVDVPMTDYDAAKVDQTATVHITANAVENKFEASTAKNVTVTYVDKTPLTVTGTAAQTMTYSGSGQAFVEGTVTGSSTLTEGDTNGYEVKYYNTDGTGETTTAPTNAGTYNVVIAPKGTETANYKEVGSPTNSAYTLTIAPKSITVNSATATNRVYDGTKAVAVTAVTLNGVVVGDASNVSVDLSKATGAMANEAVGNSKQVNLSNLELTGSAKANYTLAATAINATTVNITAPALTVRGKTAANVSTGDAAGGIEVLDLLEAASGLVNGEVLSGINTAAFAGKTLAFTEGSDGVNDNTWVTTVDGSTVTVIFYEKEATDTSDDTKRLADGTFAAGEYPFTIALTADNTFGNYNLQILAVPDANAFSGKLTVANPPSGGGVSSYTVTYEVGEHGKLAEGAKKTESVNHKKNPKRVPEVIANEGYRFLGWSLDGETVVDPTAEMITKRTTFTALYEETEKTLAFEKSITEPYIKGIEENGELLFKPEAPMTRGEVAAMLVRTLNLKLDTAKDYAADKFPDLNGDEWYAQAVGYLAELGVMKGMEDGTCSAESYITRAEFVALVMRIDGLTNGESKFSDVSADNWAAEYITAASAKGYVDGNEYGNFLPGADITRASVVKIMNSILGWTETATGEMLFSDVAEDHWAYGDVVKASTGK